MDESSSRKTKKMSFRVIAQEQQLITAKAAEAQMTVSEFMTAAALDKEIKVIDKQLLKSNLYELQKVGTNLNQLLILAHQGRISCPNLDAVCEMHKQLLKTFAALK